MIGKSLKIVTMLLCTCAVVPQLHEGYGVLSLYIFRF